MKRLPSGSGPLSLRSLLAVAVCFQLTAAGTVAAEPNVPDAPSTREVARRRRGGDYFSARDAAQRLLRTRQGDPATRPYQLREAEVLARTLDQVTALPPDQRAELALADRLEFPYNEANYAGRSQEADSLARLILAIRERVLGPEHPETADAMVSVAIENAEDPGLADSLLHRALAIRLKVFGEGSPRTASNLSDLAGLARRRRDDSMAQELYSRAHAIFRRLRCVEDSAYSSCLATYAVFRETAGDRISGEALLREAVRSARRYKGTASADTRYFMRLLAVLLNDEARYAEAKALFRELLALHRTEGGPDSPDIVSDLRGLGFVLAGEGNLDSTAAFYREALEMSRRVYPAGDPRVADAAMSQGGIVRDLGRYAEAESLLDEALRGREKLRGRRSTSYAFALAQKAESRRQQGRAAEAVRLYDEALALAWEADRDPLNYYYLTMLVFSGFARLGAGQPAAAESLLSLACAGYERRLLGSGGGLRKVFSTLPSPYPYLCLARLAQNRGDSAWESAEQGLARVLGDLLVHPNPGLREEEKKREDELFEVALNLRSLVGVLGNQPEDGRKADDQRRLESARDSLVATEIALATLRSRSKPERDEPMAGTPILDRVRKALEPDQALIGWLDVEERRGSYQSWAYAVRNQGPVSWFRLEAPGGDLPPGRGTAPFQDFLDEVSRPPRPLADLRESNGRVLWRSRFRPLLPALGGVTGLVVIPSGLMVGIPIEALPDDAGAHLGDLYAVSYVSSAMNYVRIHERARRSRFPSGALLLGDPMFSDRPLAQASAGPLPLSRSLLRSVLRGERATLSALPALPSSRTEVDRISGICRPSTVLLQREASEQSLSRMARSGQLGHFGVIHLATHAILDNDDPEQSALVLSQVDLPDPGREADAGRPVYDGLLRVDEILHRWKLNAELVTLSACETALGRKIGDEGYVGFSQALLAAGASSLLLSLWKVDDRATALLMQRFYENRAGLHGARMSNAEALRQARTWLRSYADDTGRSPYRHPYFWAGFILMGHGGTSAGSGTNTPPAGRPISR